MEGRYPDRQAQMRRCNWAYGQPKYSADHRPTSPSEILNQLLIQRQIFRVKTSRIKFNLLRLTPLLLFNLSANIDKQCHTEVTLTAHVNRFMSLFIFLN